MLKSSNVSRKICICGRSSEYPICDGSHRSAQWSCEINSKDTVKTVISTGTQLYNLAQRIAHKLDAIVLTEHSQIIPQKLIRLCNVTSPYPTPHLQAEKTLNLAIDVPIEYIARQAPNESVRVLKNTEPMKLYSQAIKHIQNEMSWTPSLHQKLLSAKRIFLSHSVSDQSRLSWLINQLRARYTLEVFVCSDSLNVGNQWYIEIIEALESTDLMIQVITEASVHSTFCAFEAGFAVACHLPILLLCFDQGVLPPAHLQHFQAYELWKVQLSKPWLNIDELALSIILKTIVDREFISKNDESKT